MSSKEPSDSLIQTIRTARLATACFALAMLCAGLAPAISTRVVTGRTPPASDYAAGSIALVLTVVLLALCVLMRPARLWPFLTAFGISAAMTLGSVLALIMAGPHPASIFPLLMSGAAAATCWLAVDAQRRPATSAPVPPRA